MADTKVSRLIRVKQGRTTIQFELLGDSLTIELPRKGQKHTCFTVQKEGVAVLKELLGAGPAAPVTATEPTPVHRIEESQRPDGLIRFDDGIVGGMQ